MRLNTGFASCLEKGLQSFVLETLNCAARQLRANGQNRYARPTCYAVTHSRLSTRSRPVPLPCGRLRLFLPAFLRHQCAGLLLGRASVAGGVPLPLHNLAPNPERPQRLNESFACSVWSQTQTICCQPLRVPSAGGLSVSKRNACCFSGWGHVKRRILSSARRSRCIFDSIQKWAVGILCDILL